jgi:hypothetical protein
MPRHQEAKEEPRSQDAKIQRNIKDQNSNKSQSLNLKPFSRVGIGI